MIQFSSLYQSLPPATRSFGRFLASMDSEVLAHLAWRVCQFEDSSTPAVQDPDLLELARLVRHDTPALARVAVEDILQELFRCVDDARLIRLGLLDGCIESLCPGLPSFATPTDLCVMALGGCSQLHGAVLH